MKIQKLLAALIAAGLLTGLAADAGAASKKKQTKSGLSAAEKAELRKIYMPICIKQYAQGGNGIILKVEVRSDGTVHCWHRN